MLCPESPPLFFGTTGAIIGQLITWLLVIIGWYFVDRTNNRRETRKELRAALSELQAFLDQIENDAVSYHTSREPNNILSSQLKRDLHRRLPTKITVMDSRGYTTTKLVQPVVEFRKSITFENFDTSKFRQQTISDPIIRRIGIARDSLGEQLEIGFSEQYK